jgi:hypothetical protein
MIMGDLVRLCSVTARKLKILHDHGRSVGGMQGMSLAASKRRAMPCLVTERGRNDSRLFKTDFLFLQTKSVTLYLHQRKKICTE